MSSVGPLAAGFKQVPAGGYVTIISSLNCAVLYSKPVTTGSGGSATVAAPVAVPLATIGPVSTLLRAGNVLKDMGSSVVSSSRVFRKFKAVGLASTAGGYGDLSTADNNFGTFYLEVTGDGGDVPDANKSLLARF
jgi:hypothetical protein